MRLLIDLIACQTESRNRGIGRYTLELTRELINQKNDNEVYCLANPLFPETFEQLRQEFVRLLPQGKFLPYFHEPIPDHVSLEQNPYTQLASNMINHSRQVLSPDFVITPSLFEEWGNSKAVVPLPIPNYKGYNQGAILYDLIPYLFQGNYLDPNPLIKQWYMSRVKNFKNYDLLFAISEATRQDAINLLHIASEKILNISGAQSKIFKKINLSYDEKKSFFRRKKINRPFIFYLGNTDFRKNMDGALKAYASLPKDILDSYQFVLNNPGNLENFQRKIHSLGISNQNVVVLDKITDEELITLYNLCTVFFFPSLYEGFGLPILEAMACGAPVISANNSSLSEVVGRKDALFDVDNINDIVSKLSKVLSDNDYRLDLSNYGLERVKCFSWESSAKRTWEAIEKNNKNSENKNSFSISTSLSKKPHLAYFSPLPPQESGISYYSADLLPYLSRYFSIDLFIEPGIILDDSLNTNEYGIFPWSKFHSICNRYATAVYQHGNSSFHSHMDQFEKNFPGVIVLHDFYLSHSIQSKYPLKDEFVKQLENNHGIKSLLEFYKIGYDMIWNWPMNWPQLYYSKEIIVHSSFHNILLEKFYKTGWKPKLNIIPQLRTQVLDFNYHNKSNFREKLGINQKYFAFGVFGLLSELKLIETIIIAYRTSLQFFTRPSYLFFVGKFISREFELKIKALVEQLELEKNIHFTGFVNDEVFVEYLQSLDAAIQLRSNSRGETSRAILDCMAYGLPVIINNHGTNVDFDDNDVIKIGDPVNIEELSQVMIRTQKDDRFRSNKSTCSREKIASAHNPEVISASYAEVIDRAISADDRVILKPSITSLLKLNASHEMIRFQAKYAAKNHNNRKLTKIIVDVSETNRSDLRTGIQRVVKRIVKEWLLNEDKSLRIEPVYIENGKLFRASRFIEKIIDIPAHSLGQEGEILLNPGDYLLMLDTSWGVYNQYYSIFEKVRKNGGKIISLIYDLIPLLYPQFCDENTPAAFSKWFYSARRESDVFICISETIAKDVKNYVSEGENDNHHKLDVSFFHLGADIPIASQESNIRNEINQLHLPNKALVFSSIGTIEPRKGHAFTLDAFEKLWENGFEGFLVFAGKIGWNVGQIENRIRNHPELNKQFFFIENPSDAELDILYNNTTAVIIASAVEGYGLPIVEAALHKTPVLASDIPVFHEVAGEGACYFSLQSPNSLAEAVKLIAKLTPEERAKMAQKIKTLTWKESAQQLLSLIMNNDRSKDLQILSSPPNDKSLEPTIIKKICY